MWSRDSKDDVQWKVHLDMGTRDGSRVLLGGPADSKSLGERVAYLDRPMDITKTDHRPRSHSARPMSLAERLEQIFMLCRKYPRTLKTGRLEKQEEGLRGH
jgi:hypothetical protein